MLSISDVDELFLKLCDRFTPEEFVEAMGINIEDLINRYLDEAIEFDWSEYL